MPNFIQGEARVPDGRIAIVVAKYNENITSKLLDGSLKTFADAGVSDESVDVAWVPGAWELPVVAAKMARSGRYVGVLTLGAVIRGETTHDQHINRQVSLSLGQLSLETGLPVIFGVLTCNSLEQAIQRSGGTVGNKGAECASAALEMIDLLGKIEG